MTRESVRCVSRCGHYGWCVDQRCRYFALAAAVATLVVACGGPGTPAAVAQDRDAVIEQLRAIDTCALFGDLDSVDGKPMTVSGPASALSCDARIAGGADDIDVKVGLNIGNVEAAEEQSWIKHRTIDGIDVTSASLWDSPDAPPRDQVVSWTCSFAAQYPDQARLTVFVSAPPEVDACAIGDALIRTAMQRYSERPHWGSTEFPTTVLTGADPCAAVARLEPAHQVEIDTASTSVNTCAFTVDGSPMITVSFDYLDPALQQYAADRFQIDGHPVAGDPASGVYDVLVGPEFTVGDDIRAPHVTVVDLEADGRRIRLITRAIADEY